MSGEATERVVAGRYRLTRRLARGGAGEVFAAIDLSTGARVALKRLLDQQDPRGCAYFMREYHALSELRHPRIIEVYDYGVDRGAPYYTMELLDGHDLGELAPLPYREACGYLRDVASSLALLHARRLLHRDVSSRNVRRTSDGRCKLIDFGAMMPFGTPPNVIGTPPCVPPEALQGGALDQRSDLFALGALAYHLLTGRHAYPASDLSALTRVWTQGIQRPSRRASEIPEALDQLVIALLSLDPMKRPSSAAEVIDWLSAIAELPADDNLAVGRSFLASSQLVGRHRECALLLEHLTKAAQARGSALVISGESGSGKTRMLSEAALIGQTCGLTVVRVALRERRGLSSSFVHDVVAGVHQVAPVEAELASRRLPLVLDALHDAARDSDRSALLSQVGEYVREVASARPLLLTVDDVHHADELASALLAALAHRTSGCALALIASHDSRKPASVLMSAPGLATTLPLAPLNEAQTATLSASLFGDVPNLERITDRFFKIAQGNPKITLQLAEQLLARGTLRYVDGAWVLPAELADPLPQGTADALMLRLEPLSADARALAELLSVRRGGASVEQLLALVAPRAPESLFRALEELVSAGILESAGDEYAFVQDALRVELGHSLAQRRSQELHQRWADHLLARARPDHDSKLEAGWHLVHTADELRGAELLAEVAPVLVDRRISMAAAVPALERALEVFERRDRSLATRLRLRALLVMCSFLFDFKLADRYGTQTLDAIYPFTGLAEAERCARWFGKRIGFFLGLGWSALRWCFRSAAKRGPFVTAAVKAYAQSTMGLVGLRALAVDTRGVQALLERMRAFEDAPHSTLAVVYSIARAIDLHGRGRGAEVHAAIDQALERLERGRSFQMSQHEHADLMMGLLLLQGINESYRERSRSLECAERLERLGTPFAEAASLRVSMTYYLLRGDFARAQHFRRLLDLKAIQNGSHWQVEWIAVPLEGFAASTWSDVIALRRVLARFDRLIQEAPALATLRDAQLIPYYFRRGEYARAIELGQAFMREHPPRSRVGWAATYAVIAFSYVELGMIDRALAICETALANISDADRDYFVFNTPLDAAYATVLAVTGERERSREVFRAAVERLRACGGHSRAIVMHEYRIRVARLLNDRAAFLAALDDLREAAIASRHPSAIALVHRLSEGRGPRRDSPPPGAATPTTAAQTVTALLIDLASLEDRAQRALTMLGQYAECSEGYLYLQDADSLQLTASLDEQPPPEELRARLQALAAANDTAAPLPLDAGYYASRLPGGFVVLRAQTALPEALLTEIGRGLRRRAS
jgi:hypothetical protein